MSAPSIPPGPQAGTEPEPRSREHDLKRGVMLEVFTTAWNVVECGVAIGSGVAAGSVVLLGYGFDSLIEATSGVVVGLHLRRSLNRSEAGAQGRDEQRTARAAGALLVALALIVAIESARRLLGAGPHPRESVTGMVLTLVAALVMPGLGAAKLRLARRLESSALRIEAEQTIACAFFSLTTLTGLALNARFHWWWADPVMALVLVPWMLREGLEPWSEREA